MDPVRDIAALRRMLAGLEAERLPSATSYFTLGAGAPGLDEVALARGSLHEVRAAGSADLPAATGFTLGMVLRAAAETDGTRPVLWVRQETVDAELGRLDGLGLATLGLDPARLILVRAPDALDVLRAAGDAVNCPGLGALIIEPWGEPRALDLTATRRLSLRAAASGVTSFLLHATASQPPTAVATRWRVAPAPSAPFETDAPGHPAFSVTLLRHRGGEGLRPVEGGTWNLEWDHEACSFRDLPPLSGAVVPVPAGRPAGAHPAQEPAAVTAFRRAG